jgi:hypothetical protein
MLGRKLRKNEGVKEEWKKEKRNGEEKMKGKHKERKNTEWKQQSKKGRHKDRLEVDR